jgi:hypothetical protein
MEQPTPISQKRCRFCKSEIDASATRCPHCHGDLRNVLRRHPVVTAIAAIAILLFVRFAIYSVNLVNETMLSDDLSASSSSPEELQAAHVSLARLKATHDDINGITSYVASSSPETYQANDISLYLRQRDGSAAATLRLLISYTGDDWLFVERYKFNVDGQAYTITPDSVDRDNGLGGVWEWSDDLLSKDNLAIVRAIAGSSKATIRYEGKQYYKDREITAQEKAALTDVLGGYLALTAR